MNQETRFLFLKYKEGIEKTKQKIARLDLKISLSDQANLENFVKNYIWYRGGESNSHIRKDKGS